MFRQSVRVAETGRDRYGRVIGTVYLGNVDVNAQMVREGMAWVYRQYAKDRGLYELERRPRPADAACGLILSQCPRGSIDVANASTPPREINFFTLVGGALYGGQFSFF